MLQIRSFSRNDVNVLFAENNSKNKYNCAKLGTLQEQVLEIVPSEITDGIQSTTEKRL